VILVGNTALAKEVLKDQSLNSESAKWVHSLLAGVDAICAVPEFQSAEHLVLTNAKGAFNAALAEFLVYGVLYFVQRRDQVRASTVEFASDFTLGIVGYGDIGHTCAKQVKAALGMRIIGLKRTPAHTSEEQRQVVDEVVGYDKLDYLLSESDFVLNMLPYTQETHELFDKEKFKHMKPSSVYINLGRGKTTNEADLAAAVESGVIRGVVLDVFYEEPLPPESELWAVKDKFVMTPHAADLTEDYFDRTVQVFLDNLKLYA